MFEWKVRRAIREILQSYGIRERDFGVNWTLKLTGTLISGHLLLTDKFTFSGESLIKLS